MFLFWKKDNVTTLNLASGFSKYFVFCTNNLNNLSYEEENLLMINQVGIISNHESMGTNVTSISSDDNNAMEKTYPEKKKKLTNDNELTNNHHKFNLNGTNKIQKEISIIQHEK